MEIGETFGPNAHDEWVARGKEANSVTSFRNQPSCIPSRKRRKAFPTSQHQFFAIYWCTLAEKVFRPAGDGNQPRCSFYTRCQLYIHWEPLIPGNTSTRIHKCIMHVRLYLSLVAVLAAPILLLKGYSFKTSNDVKIQRYLLPRITRV